MGIVDEYKEIKEQTDADLLAMQVGDFYEFFDEDARTVSKELGLKISEKSSHGSSYPMAGVPINDLQDYVETLVDSKSYTVAVADQYKEDGVHKREIDRVITPGTLVENTSGDVRYLSTVLVGSENSGIALTDLNSGQILTREVENSQVVDELAVYDPVEVIISYETHDKELVDNIESSLTNYFNTRVVKDAESTNVEDFISKFESEFGDETARSIGIDESRMAVASVGKIIQYLEKTKTDVKRTISKVRKIGDEDYMKIDARTRYSLEISETMRQGSGSSLFDVIDHTVTTNGSEKLQKYIQRPLTNQDDIVERHTSVESMVNQGLAREDIRSKLESIPNLQRIASKSAYGTATPRDVKNIAESYKVLKNLKEVFSRNDQLLSSPLFRHIKSLEMDELKYLRNMINSALEDDPPNSVEEGIIKTGFDDDLDEIVREHESHKEELEEYRKSIADNHQITHLTIGRNKTDGFYLQVGNSESDLIPDDLNQIKNLKNSFRYKNDKIREHENAVLRLEEKREDKEEEIFEELLEELNQNKQLLQNFGEAVSHVDAIQSLATHAVQNKWVKPTVNSGSQLDIAGGRHPVVEQTVDFVPNGTIFTADRRFLIVTGPNMAGKSTYLRQVALICVLAQSGSYVPCEEAEIGMIDSVFARVGSVDEISEGRSTFMVEMSELANILHSSTDNSLVILDEVGRGTATYDGVSIARSTVEYLSEDNGHPTPMCLFATHYHELTSMAEEIENVENIHLPIKSRDGEYSFTHKVVEGAADESYGIRVARMAGVPDPVIDRSEDILSDLREDEQEE